mgnify:CR=1 FL=1
MKKALVFLLPLLGSCEIFSEKAIEDFVEGEAKVAEKLIEDINAQPQP